MVTVMGYEMPWYEAFLPHVIIGAIVLIVAICAGIAAMRDSHWYGMRKIRRAHAKWEREFYGKGR